MRNIAALVLLFGLSVAFFGQKAQTKPQKAKAKIAPKTQKIKPKIARKKPVVKASPKPDIEATTKDGKAVTLKPSGRWEYVKPETVAKTEVKTEAVVKTEAKTETVAKTETKPKTKSKKETKTENKPEAKPSPTAKLITAPTATPAAAPTATPTTTPTPAPTATPTPTPTPKAMPNPTVNPSPVAKSTPAPKTKAFIDSNKCDLTLKDSPTIRGLKLGMSRDDADRLIPLDRVNVINSPTIISYPQYSRAAGFENIYQVAAQFSENKLDDLEIVYDTEAVKWKNAKEFAENLSANFNLPSKFWKYNARNAAWSEMQCREFSITIDSAANEIRLQKIAAVAQKGEPTKTSPKMIFKP